jgi:ABC-type nitrate/sulfonate/bicarbonate transport system substrate-binding protein
MLLACGALVPAACGRSEVQQPGATAHKTATAQLGDGIFHGKIKAGHLVALDMAPLFVAKEAGFFKAEGLDLETVFFANPGDNNAALAGGSIQFSTNPFTLPYFAENSGVPMRIISSAGGEGVMQVIIQGNYGVSSMEELAKWVKTHKDKKLKVATLKGDTLEMILYRSFRSVGLTYDDFEMVWFNDLLAMVQSFETRQTDILSHIQPYTVGFQLQNGAKLLTNNSLVWGQGTPNCTVSVMNDFANKYPKTVEGYLAALQRGFQLIVDDPVKAQGLLVKGNYYRVRPEVLLQALRSQKKVVLRPNVNGMMICINDMVAAGYIKPPKESIVRLEFLDRVEQRFKTN